MDNIVDILDRMTLRQCVKSEHVEANSVIEDRFLIDEGLSLLAAYRTIDDEGVRQAIRALVEALAKVSQDLAR